MIIEEKLKLYILQRYKSISAFSKELNIPNTTINSILKRGIRGTAISTVSEICKKLNIDIEALNEGAIRPKSKDIDLDINLSIDEKDIIYKYRFIDSYSKNNLLFILNNEYKRELTKRNSNIKIEDIILPSIARSTDKDSIGLYINKNDFLKKIANIDTIKKDEDF